jgi:hypothetical protein
MRFFILSSQSILIKVPYILQKCLHSKTSLHYCRKVSKLLNQDKTACGSLFCLHNQFLKKGPNTFDEMFAFKNFPTLL